VRPDPLDFLQAQYEAARDLRQLLVGRLLLAVTITFGLKWLNLLPWAAFVVVLAASAILSGLALRAERHARARCRKSAVQVAELMGILPRSDSRPRVR